MAERKDTEERSMTLLPIDALWQKSLKKNICVIIVLYCISNDDVMMSNYVYYISTVYCLIANSTLN